MKRHYALLGLEPGASVEEIKRAYAKLLKRTRPEDDLAAFQALQEAFEQCLAAAKRPVQATTLDESEDEGDEDGDTDESPDAYARVIDEVLDFGYTPASQRPPTGGPGQDAPAAGASEPTPPAPPDPRVLETIELLVERAERLHPEDLQKWLATTDVLVDFDLQLAVSRELPRYLLGRRSQVNAHAVGVLEHFLLGGDYHLGRVDDELRRDWEKLEALGEFNGKVSALRHRLGSRAQKLAFAEITSPPSQARREALLQIPAAADVVRTLVSEIYCFDQEFAANFVEHEAKIYWHKVSDEFPAPAFDTAHATTIGFSTLALVLSIVQILVGNDPEQQGAALAGVTCALIASLVLVLSGRRFRWEALLAIALVSWGAFAVFALLLDGRLPIGTIAGLACCTGVLGMLVTDVINARVERVAPVVARLELNIFALLLAGIGFIAGLGAMAASPKTIDQPPRYYEPAG